MQGLDVVRAVFRSPGFLSQITLPQMITENRSEISRAFKAQESREPNNGRTGYRALLRNGSYRAECDNFRFAQRFLSHASRTFGKME